MNTNTLISCPQCGKMVNPRGALCPFCNALLSDAMSTSPPACPKCNLPLHVMRRDEIEIDLCSSCGGLWLDRLEFEILTAESTVYREEKLTKEYSRPPLPRDNAYIPCVRCGKLMVKKNYARISGVIIDECGRHGIWLDRGELETIRQFIVSGGLEKVLFKECDKNKQGLKELVETVQETAFTHKLIHFWDWKRWFFIP